MEQTWPERAALPHHRARNHELDLRRVRGWLHDGDQRQRNQESEAMNDAVHTPETLARRWHCSERHVRNLIARGDLQAFRVGRKLLRIRESDVEAYQDKWMTGALPDCAGDTPSPGMNQDRTAEPCAAATASTQTTRPRRPAVPRLDTRS